MNDKLYEDLVNEINNISHLMRKDYTITDFSDKINVITQEFQSSKKISRDHGKEISSKLKDLKKEYKAYFRFQSDLKSLPPELDDNGEIMYRFLKTSSTNTEMV